MVNKFITDETIIELLKQEFEHDPNKYYSVNEIIDMLRKLKYDVNTRTIYGKIDKLLLFGNVNVRFGNKEGTWYTRREFKYNDK